MWTTAMLVFAVSMTFASLRLPADARIVPLVIGIPTVVLCILLLIGERYPGLLRRLDVSIMESTKESPGSDANGGEYRPKEFTKLTIMAAWMIGFFVCVYLIGFLAGIALFVLAFLLLHARISWWKSLATMVGVWLFIYALFEWLLGAGLFEGIIFGG